MFSSKNIVKYILIFICTQFVIADFSCAAPIPVFCLAGWLNYNACKNISYIIERDPASLISEKRYDLYKSYIIERDSVSLTSEKRYDLYKTYIIERDPASLISEKRYDLYKSYIIERDPASLISEKRYDLYK